MYRTQPPHGNATSTTTISMMYRFIPSLLCTIVLACDYAVVVVDGFSTVVQPTVSSVASVVVFDVTHHRRRRSQQPRCTSSSSTTTTFGSTIRKNRFITLLYSSDNDGSIPSDTTSDYATLDEDSTIHSDNNDDATTTPTQEQSKQQQETAIILKNKLYQLAASYDRGFSGTPRAFTEANDIIDKLKEVNPTMDASRGIFHRSDRGSSVGDVDDDVPLKAVWRMIWTSAFDVVSLGASPVVGEFNNVWNCNVSCTHVQRIAC